MPAPGVRLARTSDVDDIAGVTVRAWRQRLAGLVPDESLSALRADDLALTWASAILNPPTRDHLLLVAVDDDVTGYASLGPNGDPDAAVGIVELLALEVDPTRQREGHGSRLMAAALDHAVDQSATMARTWCPLADEVRRAFLQSAGWAPDTAYRDVAVGVDDSGADITVREVRLATLLT